jgi:mannose-1-phosphate guanylyltransferase
VERIQPLVPREKILIVTSRAQARRLLKEVPQIPRQNLLLEPWGRNTAPCLALAAVHVQKRSPGAVMIALPADHHIGKRGEFLGILRRAAEFASRGDYLLTLGITPTAPETGYGYIQKGECLGRVEETKVYRARTFREKPTLPTAKRYLRRGDTLWNSGMFIWKAEAFLDGVKKFLPGLYRPMRELQAAIGKRGERKLLERIYSRCPSISVDCGIMEKAGNVALIESRFGWSDVGSWSVLWNLWPKDPRGNVHLEGKKGVAGRILSIDSSGCLIRGEKTLIAVLGLKDLVVAEAGEAILVCPRDRSQDVRRVLEELRARRWRKYL